MKNEQYFRRFRVKRPIQRIDKYNNETETIQTGTEFDILGQVVMMNGGILPPVYSNFMRNRARKPTTLVVG